MIGFHFSFCPKMVRTLLKAIRNAIARKDFKGKYKRKGMCVCLFLFFINYILIGHLMSNFYMYFLL